MIFDLPVLNLQFLQKIRMLIFTLDMHPIESNTALLIYEKSGGRKVEANFEFPEHFIPIYTCFNYMPNLGLLKS